MVLRLVGIAVLSAALLSVACAKTITYTCALNTVISSTDARNIRHAIETERFLSTEVPVSEINELTAPPQAATGSASVSLESSLNLDDVPQATEYRTTGNPITQWKYSFHGSDSSGSFVFDADAFEITEYRRYIILIDAETTDADFNYISGTTITITKESPVTFALGITFTLETYTYAFDSATWDITPSFDFGDIFAIEVSVVNDMLNGQMIGFNVQAQSENSFNNLFTVTLID
jgi:hypothetical protein